MEDLKVQAHSTIQAQSEQQDLKSAEASNCSPSLKAPSQNLYNDALRAELIELQSDTDLLFQQLQALSRHRLSQVGSHS